jgi:hypothetical protein
MLALTTLSHNRAPRKSSWRLINYLRRSSRSSITTSCDQSVSQLNQSATALGKALGQVVSSARAWTRRRKQRRFVSWSSAWRCSRTAVGLHRSRYDAVTTASTRQTLARDRTALEAIQSKILRFPCCAYDFGLPCPFVRTSYIPSRHFWPRGSDDLARHALANVRASFCIFFPALATDVVHKVIFFSRFQHRIIIKLFILNRKPPM